MHNADEQIKAEGGRVSSSRSHDQQNELTVMDQQTRTFDQDGNQTTDQNGKTLTWDAWNQVVGQKNGQRSSKAIKLCWIDVKLFMSGTTLAARMSSSPSLLRRIDVEAMAEANDGTMGPRSPAIGAMNRSEK